MEFPKDSVTQATLKKIEKFTKMENFKPAYVRNISQAAGALCEWVLSIEDYSKVLKVVAPKRARKEMAEEQLRKKIAFLEELEAEFKILADRLAALQEKFDKTNAEMEAFKRELDQLQVKIDRGDKLISGLSGEKTRWEATLIELDDKFIKLIGDCMLASAFMSYCGPFPSEYRDSLIFSWISIVEQ
jgi:dynein heavy chain